VTRRARCVPIPRSVDRPLPSSRSHAAGSQVDTHSSRSSEMSCAMIGLTEKVNCLLSDFRSS
jgi:hypothetical protein